jgi:hypothetical protein
MAQIAPTARLGEGGAMQSGGPRRDNLAGPQCRKDKTGHDGLAAGRGSLGSQRFVPDTARSGGFHEQAHRDNTG